MTALTIKLIIEQFVATVPIEYTVEPSLKARNGKIIKETMITGMFFSYWLFVVKAEHMCF
jgi:hypothetical protein